MKTYNRLSDRKGIALIITIGILAMMSIIATSFSFSMKLELETAVNFNRSVKALYTAQSGTNKVIADIRAQVIPSTYVNLISYINSYDTSEQTLTGQGTYQITIGSASNIGEDQKVNLNALDDTDSTWIGRLQTAGLTYDDIAQIIDYRDCDSDVTSQLYTTGGWVACTGNETNTKNSNFTSVEEVRLIITDAKYNTIRNDVTIYAPIIRGGLLTEYYDSISGSSPNVQIVKTSFVGKVIEPGEVSQFNWQGWTVWDSMPGTDGEWNGWFETHYAAWAGGYLLTGTGASRLDTYGVIFKGYIDVLPAETGSAVTFYLRAEDGARLFIDTTQVISAWYDKASMDPEVSGTYTFNYPGWHPIRIEYYANTGENDCALKWSLTGADDISPGTGNYVPAERLGFPPIVTHPTESNISYPSAGIYNITSIGRIKDAGGTPLAEKRTTSVVKIFGVWTQTTREEFSAPWTSNPGTKIAGSVSEQYFSGNYQDGHVFNVNWLNSCPDNASADLEAGGYTTTVNALKLGYWDNFDEDLAYSTVNLMAMGKLEIEGPTIYGPEDPDSAYIEDKTWASTDWWWNPPDPDSTTNRNNTNPAGDGYFALTSDKITTTSVGGNSTTKLRLDTGPFTALDFEVNFNFYRPATNIFARTWISSSEYPSHRICWRGGGTPILQGDPEWAKVKFLSDGDNSYWYYDIDNDGRNFRDFNGSGTRQPATEPWDTNPIYHAYNNPATPLPESSARVYIYGTNLETTYSASGAYWQPHIDYVVPYFYARGDRQDTNEAAEPYDLDGLGYYTLVTDDDGWMSENGGTPLVDRLELSFQYNPSSYARTATSLSPGEYDPTYVLAMIKDNNSTAYRAYLDGGVKTAELTPTTAVVVPNFKFRSNNVYAANWLRNRAIWMRGAPLDTVTHYFDNIRFIPHDPTNPNNNGIFVSTPFDAGESITWGRVSWTEKNEADPNLSVAIGLRTAASKAALPATDTGWTSVTNGAQITNTGRWLQYKATLTLTTTALDRTNYANSGKTPIFQDITITYLPRVEVLFYREIIE